jgi:hypothetical protein
MRPPAKSIARPLLGLLAGALLAGCGGGSSGNGVEARSPEQILAAAKGAAEKAATVHIAGSIVNEGTPLSIDLELVSGKGGKGRIVESGLDFKLVALGKWAYINGSPAFYRRVAGSAAAQLLQGRWLKAPVAGSFASIGSLTNLGKLVDTTLNSHGTLVRNGTTTIAGRKAVGVKDSSEGGVLYVATTGEPYPLQLAKQGKGGGEITFDRWNQPVTLEAPANAVNIDQLQSGH